MKRVTVYSNNIRDEFEVIGTYYVPQCTEIIVIKHVIYKVDEEFPDEAYPAKVSYID